MGSRTQEYTVRWALAAIVRADDVGVPDLEQAAEILLARHPERPRAYLAGALAAEALARYREVDTLRLALGHAGVTVHRALGHQGPRTACAHKVCRALAGAGKGKAVGTRIRVLAFTAKRKRHELA